MTSLPAMIFESLFDFAMHKYEEEMPHTYHTKEFGKRTGPKPVTSPYGQHYRMHPELSRPVFGIMTTTFAAPAAYVAAPVTLAAINYAVIEQDVPEEQRSGYWQMYSSALTGTFGGGFSGIV
jgi:hypothetical protein